MHKFRFLKKISLWLFIITQIILITLYFYAQNNSINISKPSSEKVSFLGKLNITKEKKYTYHTVSDHLTLKLINTRDSYVDFNTSLCFINGTDIRAMRKASDLNWNCKCLPTWHGKDCSQPEVIWRALLAYRKPTKIKGPRKYQRRIIYLFNVNQLSEAITEIRVSELNDIVDLFVLYDNENKSELFGNKLKKGLLKSYHNKILYIRNHYFKQSLVHLKNIITNLNDDDIILYNEENVIPNKLALIFFKYYNNWPEPLNFRLRWSVYGFFWIHPLRTEVKGFASTVRYLHEMLNNNLTILRNSSAFNNSFTLGDLNHYGGWYCELCNEVNEIIQILISNKRYSTVLEKLGKQTLDSNSIEELIENGVYLDGKTELTRGHRFNENYFAPIFVCENSWKFDYLLVNMYSKLDYYQ